MPPLLEFELPYQTEFIGGGALRPYLWLNLTGPNGIAQRVRGVLDTGADSSSLPYGYAVALGLDPTQAIAGYALGAGGTRFPTFTWPNTIRASVPAAEAIYQFDLVPTYVPGATQALWGRADFFFLWEFELDERAHKFKLRSRAQMS